MSKNSDYAKFLNKRLHKMPSVLAEAVGRAAYSAVLNNTVQDSGEAAYNWRAQINTNRVFPFKSMRGRPPVGSSGDKRSRGFDRSIVIEDRLSDFIGRLQGKKIKFIHIYNPLEDDDHAFHARLEEARGVADNAGWLSSVAREALNAHLR